MRYLIVIATLLVMACQPKKQEEKVIEIITMNNTLTDAQKAEGWQLLFDGKSTAGWRNFNSQTIGSAWVIDDEALHLNTSQEEGRGDIITEGEYENFELALEWKIDSCGNSGIFFNVVEDPKYKWTFLTGPEMQVLDNNCHPDAKIIKHRAGDLYDMISCSTETVRPAGEWNQVRIVSNNGDYQFWLNGVNVVNFTMHTPEWDAMVAGSKFVEMPDFGKARKGHIALQDHGDRVWFRNIMIKPL
jgi:cytochrome c